MSKKNNNLTRLRNSDTFPKDFLDIYEKDYDELIIEEEEKANKLNNDLKNRLFMLFDQGYDGQHIQNIIHTQLVRSIDVKNVI